MPVKIRLMRIGARKRPFYRVVAVDERKKRTGGYLEALGTYNPLTEPKEVILNKERITWWMEHGAVPSYGYLRIIKEAPQRAPRKAKKEKKEESAPAVKEEIKPETETPAAESTGQPEIEAETETPAVESAEPQAEETAVETENTEEPKETEKEKTA